MDRFTLALLVGAIAGIIDVVPMLTRRLPLRFSLSAFCTYLFAGILVFYSDLPYLPWWADGIGITLMLAFPTLLALTGKDRKIVPMLLNAVLLGFLIGVAKHYI